MIGPLAWLSFLVVLPSTYLLTPWIRQTRLHLTDVERFPDVWLRSLHGSGGVEAQGSALSLPDFDVQQIKYCEDVHSLDGRPSFDGWAILSCDPGRATWNTVMGNISKPEPRGALWLYNFVNSTAIPQLLSLNGFPEKSDFHPLGIAHFFASSSGEDAATLFVVNHQEQASSIDLFQLTIRDDVGKLNFIRSITHPLATHTANAIAPLSSTEFFVSQDHFFAHRPPSNVADLKLTYLSVLPLLLRWAAGPLAQVAQTKLGAAWLPKMETYLSLPLGWVTHVRLDETDMDHVRASVSLGGIAFTNGVALSPNRDYLAVASTMGRAVHMFGVDRAAGTEPPLIQYQSTIPVPILVDNIAFTKGKKGDVLIAGGSPFGLALTKFAKHPERKELRSDSWIIAIRAAELANEDDADTPYPAHNRILNANPSFAVYTLLQCKGTAIGGIASGTGAAYHDGTLLVSGLYADPGIFVARGAGI